MAKKKRRKKRRRSVSVRIKEERRIFNGMSCQQLRARIGCSYYICYTLCTKREPKLLDSGDWYKDFPDLPRNKDKDRPTQVEVAEFVRSFSLGADCYTLQIYLDWVRLVVGLKPGSPRAPYMKRKKFKKKYRRLQKEAEQILLRYCHKKKPLRGLTYFDRLIRLNYP